MHRALLIIAFLLPFFRDFNLGEAACKHEALSGENGDGTENSGSRGLFIVVHAQRIQLVQKAVDTRKSANNRTSFLVCFSNELGNGCEGRAVAIRRLDKSELGKFGEVATEQVTIGQVLLLNKLEQVEVMP